MGLILPEVPSLSLFIGAIFKVFYTHIHSHITHAGLSYKPGFILLMYGAAHFLPLYTIPPNFPALSFNFQPTDFTPLNLLSIQYIGSYEVWLSLFSPERGPHSLLG